MWLRAIAVVLCLAFPAASAQVVPKPHRTVLATAAAELHLSALAVSRKPLENVVAEKARLLHGSAGNSVTTFAHIPIGGGGAVIKMASAPANNVLLAATDQFGCYLSVSNSQWRQLITVAGMPNDGIGAVTTAGSPIANGADDCVPDPGNANNIVLGTNGSIYRSTDQGFTFSPTCYPATGTNTAPGQNPPLKGKGSYIAVDPFNSLIVYMSTPTATAVSSTSPDGLQVTYNGGATCTQIAGSGTVGIAGSFASGGVRGNCTGGTCFPGYLIAFDTSLGTTTTCPGGATICTKGIWVSTWGHGVSKSTDGGFTWTLQSASGMPTTHTWMVPDNQGHLWFVDNSTSCGNAGCPLEYDGSAWHALSGTIGSGNPFFGVAVDPNACSSPTTCKVVFMVGGGTNTGTCITLNSGSTWNCALGTKTFLSTDVAWLAPWLNAGFGLFPSGPVFDAAGNLYVGGEGVFKTVPPTSGSTLTLTSQTAGIEEALVSAIIMSPAMSGTFLAALWDINCFQGMSIPYTSFPTTSNRGCFNTNANHLQHTNSADYVSGTPADLVAMTDNQPNYIPPYVGDSGTYNSSAWSGLTAPSSVSTGALNGGCIAAAGVGNYLWAPTDGAGGNVAPLYTTDNGVHWTSISVTGVTQGWPWRYFLNSRVCASDKVNAGVYFLYNWNIGTGPDAIIKCTSNGASCANLSSPGLGNQFIPILKTPPGVGDTVWLSGGLTPFVDTATLQGLYVKPSGASTVTQVSGFTAVAAFGFGVPAPGHTYPVITVNGFYNHVWGIWQSHDWDTTQTWQKIGDYPKNLPVTIIDIEGDKNIPYLFGYGTSSGLFCSSQNPALYCGNSSFLLKRDLDPASNDNDPMWLEKAA